MKLYGAVGPMPREEMLNEQAYGSAGLSSAIWRAGLTRADSARYTPTPRCASSCRREAAIPESLSQDDDLSDLTAGVGGDRIQHPTCRLLTFPALQNRVSGLQREGEPDARLEEPMALFAQAPPRPFRSVLVLFLHSSLVAEALSPLWCLPRAPSSGLGSK